MTKAQCVFFGGVLLAGWGIENRYPTFYGSLTFVLYINTCTHIWRLYMHIRMYREEFPYIEKYLT